MKTLFGSAVAFCLAASLGAEPVDGFYWPAGWYHHLNTFQSEKRYWEGNAMPADGGVAYFTGTQAGDISFNSGSARSPSRPARRPALPMARRLAFSPAAVRLRAT